MSALEATECFAIPGQTMVDTIDSETGLTHIYGKTLEQCRAEYPGRTVERMTIDAYCESKAQAQDTPIQWEETTEDRFNEMLECLPPACYRSGGFLVGEPWDHHATTGAPRYQAFITKDGKYYGSTRPMTKTEFLKSL